MRVWSCRYYYTIVRATKLDLCSLGRSVGVLGACRATERTDISSSARAAVDPRRIYEGYSAFVGSAWGFAHEAAAHAIRLMQRSTVGAHRAASWRSRSAGTQRRIAIALMWPAFERTNGANLARAPYSYSGREIWTRQGFIDPARHHRAILIDKLRWPPGPKLQKEFL